MNLDSYKSHIGNKVICFSEYEISEYEISE